MIFYNWARYIMDTYSYLGLLKFIFYSNTIFLSDHYFCKIKFQLVLFHTGHLPMLITCLWQSCAYVDYLPLSTTWLCWQPVHVTTACDYHYSVDHMSLLTVYIDHTLFTDYFQMLPMSLLTIWDRWQPPHVDHLSVWTTVNDYQLTLKVLNFWKFTNYCTLKPLWSGMGEVMTAHTSPTLHPPSPPTVHQLSWLAL